MADQPTPGTQAETKPTPGTQAETKPTPGTSVDKTFSQDDLNKIVQQRVAEEKAKYGDYEELKTKLAKIEEANKSDLEKAVEKAAAAEAKATALEKAAEQAKWRAEVRKEKGLPESVDPLLAGETLDEIKAKADILAANMPKGKTPPFVPSDKGDPLTPPGGSDLKEFFKQALGG